MIFVDSDQKVVNNEFPLCVPVFACRRILTKNAFWPQLFQFLFTKELSKRAFSGRVDLDYSAQEIKVSAYGQYGKDFVRNATDSHF